MEHPRDPYWEYCCLHYTLMISPLSPRLVNELFTLITQLDGIYHEHLIFGNSEVLCASLASLFTGTIDSIFAEHIYDWRYHPSDKEIYTGSKCCEQLSSNNYKLCTYKGNRIIYNSLCRNVG